jgi:hypothetical protein
MIPELPSGSFPLANSSEGELLTFKGTKVYGLKDLKRGFGNVVPGVELMRGKCNALNSNPIANNKKTQNILF